MIEQARQGSPTHTPSTRGRRHFSVYMARLFLECRGCEVRSSLSELASAPGCSEHGRTDQRRSQAEQIAGGRIAVMSQRPRCWLPSMRWPRQLLLAVAHWVWQHAVEPRARVIVRSQLRVVCAAGVGLRVGRRPAGYYTSTQGTAAATWASAHCAREVRSAVEQDEGLRAVEEAVLNLE